MKMQDGPIIAGGGIGNMKLGITQKELLSIIGDDYKEEKLGIGKRITSDNVKFWINDEGKVDQIGVGKDFKGKYKGIIGIGSTLSDVKKYIGNYVEVYDTYEIENEKGICFELEDVDDWDELTAPIEYIYVFQQNLISKTSKGDDNVLSFG